MTDNRESLTQRVFDHLADADNLVETDQLLREVYAALVNIDSRLDSIEERNEDVRGRLRAWIAIANSWPLSGAAFDDRANLIVSSRRALKRSTEDGR